jgi:hypothetical protein
MTVAQLIKHLKEECGKLEIVCPLQSLCKRNILKEEKE